MIGRRGLHALHQKIMHPQSAIFKRQTYGQERRCNRFDRVLGAIPLFSEGQIWILVNQVETHAIRAQEREHLLEISKTELGKEPAARKNVSLLKDLHVASHFGHVLNGVLLVLEAEVHGIHVAAFLVDDTNLLLGRLLQHAEVVKNDVDYLFPLDESSFGQLNSEVQQPKVGRLLRGPTREFIGLRRE